LDRVWKPLPERTGARLADSSEPIPQVSLELSGFEPNEIDTLASLGLEINSSDRLRITRTGLKAAQVEAFKNDSPLQILTPPPPDEEKAGESVDADGNKVSEEGVAPEAEEKVGEVSASEIQALAPVTRQWLQTNLWPILPRMELFEEPIPLPGQVELAQLVAQQPEFETARRLLWLGGIRDMKAFQNATDRRRHQRLADASRRLSRWIRKHWSQDRQVEFRLIPDGTKINFYILIQGNERFTDPAWHSPAFNWYLSLLADLLYRRQKEGSMPILLMDEPGIHLHPRAQRDLVQVIRSLSEQTQIIYTSHYPYLMDRNFPGQLRLLQAGRGGVTIENKPYHVQGESIAWEPIRTGLGLTVGDSFLFDEYNVIVEGVTDQLLLCAISQELSEVGDDAALDLNYTAVLPAGGASQVADRAKRALAHKLRVVALFDGEKARDDDIKSFKEKVEDAAAALSLRDFYKPGYDFSVEDMLPETLYLDAVNTVYQALSETYTPIAPKYLKGKRESIVNVLQRLLPGAIEGRLEDAAPPEQDSGQTGRNAKEPKSDRGKNPHHPRLVLRWLRSRSPRWQSPSFVIGESSTKKVSCDRSIGVSLTSSRR